MALKRRAFLKTAGAAALSTSFIPAFASLQEKEKEKKLGKQVLHSDYRSDLDGVEYFFLGNGLIQAAIQTVPPDSPATHCGLLVMSPEHFGRKASTFLYHPERGLVNSRLSVSVDKKGYTPVPGSSVISWQYPDGIPTVTVEWPAGACSVREELYTPTGVPALVRTVTIENKGSAAVSVGAVLLLYPNLMFFDEYEVDRKTQTLRAIGYQIMELYASGDVTAGDRHLQASFDAIPAGERRSISFILSLNRPRTKFPVTALAGARTATSRAWEKAASLDAHHPVLNHLFRTSQSSLRAAVARSGKTDGGIWQYNMEWVRDQSVIAAGATMSGLREVGDAMIERMLTMEVDDEGKTSESSRIKPLEIFELDQNGYLLYHSWLHWMWTGNDSFLRRHWKKIEAMVRFMTQPAIRDPHTGLLRNSREFWERDGNFGVLNGYELTYQLWAILGLDRAARMARHFGHASLAAQWQATSREIKEAFLHHPRFSLIEDGCFIKRRLPDGTVQKTMTPPHRESMPPGSPMNLESVSYCDPDTASVLPIVFELVDPKGDVARKTLASMEPLWNQRWTSGGYSRYDVSSEPDSPGPWPFASLFVARAYLEAGNHPKAWRVLNWLNGAVGGKAGAWPEVYCERSTPPLPPLGYTPWTWAEMQFFLVHHMLGVRPEEEGITVRPLLLEGVDATEAVLPVRAGRLHLNLRRSQNGVAEARLNGRTVPIREGAMKIPYPQGDFTLEVAL